MTAPLIPPSKPSHWVRNVSVGVIVVMVVLAVLGSAASRQSGNVAPAAPPSAAATDAGSSADAGFPDESPSPLPSGSTLLSIKGTGPKTSDDFKASGDSVDITYDYTCGANDTFSLDFYGANESPLLPDNLVTSDPGDTDTSTTTENLNGQPGPFHVDIVSTCTWSVEVIGAP